MTCDEYQENISSFIDGELDDDTSAEMFAHVGTCNLCREFFRSVQQLHRLLRQADPEPVPASLDKRVLNIAPRRFSTRSGKAARLLWLWRSRIAMPAPAMAMLIVIALCTTFAALSEFFRSTPPVETKVVYVLGLEPIEVYGSVPQSNTPH